MDVYIGATWQIRLNRPFVAAARSTTNYFDHLLLLLRATLAFRAIVARVESRQRHHGDLQPASLPADRRVDRPRRRWLVWHAANTGPG